jgi:hypothetical protein
MDLAGCLAPLGSANECLADTVRARTCPCPQVRTTVRFWNDQIANRYAFIDGLGMAPVVPEPQTRALLVGGLGLVGWQADAAPDARIRRLIA